MVRQGPEVNGESTPAVVIDCIHSVGDDVRAGDTGIVVLRQDKQTLHDSSLKPRQIVQCMEQPTQRACAL